MKRATTLYSLAPSEMEISIHALVKRATDLLALVSFDKLISIHALVKRATGVCFSRPLAVYGFQSTPS